MYQFFYYFFSIIYCTAVISFSLFCFFLLFFFQVGWITVLDSVPDINMIDWLPDFLDGLLNMLSDGNREIRQAADTALSDFLK